MIKPAGRWAMQQPLGNRSGDGGKSMTQLETFNRSQIETVNSAAEMAEDLVSSHYKMSASQWLHRRYDIKTLADLAPEEIVHGPYAQIVRYEGHRRDRSLGSASYDLYRICLQDHTILNTLAAEPELKLFPFILYIVAHELIHIVRFSRFLQYFDATAEERTSEEKRVHLTTHQILAGVRVEGLPAVLDFYAEWRIPYDEMR
jgi:hypothetical protein